jgi:hypothetical protein
MEKELPDLSILAGRESVSVLAPDGSCAEISKMEDWRLKVLEMSELRIPDAIEVFFFNRIKAKKTREGMGTHLMKALVAVADAEGIAIVCTPLPYNEDTISRRDLIDFYRVHGFCQIHEDGLLLRMPATDED